MSRSLIVRVQSPEHGTKRIQTKATEKIQDFLQKVKEEFSLAKSGWTVYLNRDKTGELVPAKTKSLSSYKIKHGDMVYLIGGSMAEAAGAISSNAMGSFGEAGVNGQEKTFNGAAAELRSREASMVVIEDEVDQILDKQDGRIERQRNEQFCHHGPQGKCLHCVPLEPYDEQYLLTLDPPIKFLSFHSYIRKLTGGVDKGKFAMLENISCKIKSGCREHPPWPGGICTKCQPNAVTLNRQKYRHVDYIQFENPFLMERFLNYWRNTGCQRMGYMYGRYEPHKDVPLGIKAVVAAIYEPPQISQKNSIELQDDPKEAIVDQIAASLGLRKVGWIFTDLVALDLKTGTVKNFRGSTDSHFLSAEECIMAADLQSKHVNTCKLSPEGHFGSKFVTVIVTGDSNNQIHFEGYQVSNQCMALVRDDCLIPTRDAPELGYIKESSNEQYVPDVFYKDKDSYGNEVTHMARPLPVEYLLVDMPAAFPVDSLFTLEAATLNINKPFPIEHRENIGDPQDFNAFSSYLQQLSVDKQLEGLSDFHILVYMATCDMLPLRDEIQTLMDAIRTKNADLAKGFFKSEAWGTVEQLIQAHIPSPPTSRQTSYVGPNASPLPPIGGAGHADLWTCAHCTFLNQPTVANCEMCGLPK